MVFYCDKDLVVKYVKLWQRQEMLKTYDNIKIGFFILEQIMAFASSTNLVREVKN